MRRNSNSGQRPQVSFNREEEESKMRQMISHSDLKRKDELAYSFTNKIGLNEAIKSQIFPTLVTIRTCNGRVGTGFFQHSEWLVSNAHVIPAREILDEGIEVIDYQTNTLTLEAETSYHRPFDKHTAPDLVIIKTKSRSEGNISGLKANFFLNEGHNETYLFYIDIANAYEIKFLRLRSQIGKYPLIYECEDGSIPREGSSGSPIFEARLYGSRNSSLLWEFKVVSALYARCSSEWYNSYGEIRTSIVPSNTKLVCAIPVIQDFNQILSILLIEQDIIRAQQMIAVGDNSKDSIIKLKLKEQLQIAQMKEIERNLRIERFERGDSTLDILLPEGLEKLWYQGIVDISQSLMIRSVLKRELKGKANRYFDRIPDVSIKDLRDDFNSFIEEIGKLEDIELYDDDELLTSPAEYFRMDVIDSEDCWTLDLQDNTGKQNGKPLKCDGKSLSSVFAKAKLPRKIASVNGNQLVELFIASQKNKEAKDISSLTNNTQPLKPSSTKPAISKQGEKSAKNKQKYHEMEKSLTAFSLNENNHNKDVIDQGLFTSKDIDSIDINGNNNSISNEFENKKQQESGHITYDDNEILIPADGNCLYTSIFLGYLLPVIDDVRLFQVRLLELIGDKSDKVDCKVFSEWLAKNFYKIDSLKNKKFKQLIGFFRDNMKLNNGNWGGPDEIAILSQKLRIVINEEIKHISDAQKSNIIIHKEQDFKGNVSETIHILRTNANAEESELGFLPDNSDKQHLQHFRLVYSNQNQFTDKNVQSHKKNIVSKPSSFTENSTELTTRTISHGNKKSKSTTSQQVPSSIAALGESITKAISITPTSITATSTTNTNLNDIDIKINKEEQGASRIVLPNNSSSNSKPKLKH